VYRRQNFPVQTDTARSLFPAYLHPPSTLRNTQLASAVELIIELLNKTISQCWNLEREIVVNGGPRCVLVCLYLVVPAVAHLPCLPIFTPLVFSRRPLVIALMTSCSWPAYQTPSRQSSTTLRRAGASWSDRAASFLPVLIACAPALQPVFRSLVIAPTASRLRLVQPEPNSSHHRLLRRNAFPLCYVQCSLARHWHASRQACPSRRDRQYVPP